MDAKMAKILEGDKLSLEERALIIGYEVGDLQRDIFYAEHRPEERTAHLANLKLSIGDAMVQLKMLCEDLGWDAKAIEDLGWQHLKERYVEREEKGWR
jgi:hypothetical protein